MQLFSLKESTLHVWDFDWTDVSESLLGEMQSFLSPDERTRMERYKIPDDRARFCMGRALLRHLGGRYLGRDGRALQISLGDHGKPRWREPCGDLCFSVSHSGAWVMMAFSMRREVGIDVQFMDRRPRFDYMKIARHAFHPDEVYFLETCAEGLRRKKFYEIWTCKESVIKASGEGVHGAMEKFSVLPLPEREEWTHVGRWQLKSLDVDADTRAALAVEWASENIAVERRGIADAGWGVF
ncbi:MAG: 4'-phosphopantetheinyl transferase superfamily protein [Pseudomonadota bacterium]